MASLDTAINMVCEGKSLFCLACGARELERKPGRMKWWFKMECQACGTSVHFEGEHWRREPVPDFIEAFREANA